MCQILALSANSPTDISFSFEGFVNRAGNTDTNIDGTGIAFFGEGSSVRILKDEQAGLHSYVRNLVRLYQIKSTNIVAHIRRASQGTKSLSNTHPFLRELWSENWVFAHNGHIEEFPGMTDQVRNKVSGETDSELFFAYLINSLKEKFVHRPSCEDIFHHVAQVCDDYAQAGILNFVMSNGQIMIAHCSTNLYWLTRSAKEDNFVQRIDDGGVINLSAYACPDDKVSIICTLPVTNEKWNKLDNGQLLLFKDGELKLTYNGKPNVISSKYEAITGLSKKKVNQIQAEQSQFHDYLEL